MKPHKNPYSTKYPYLGKKVPPGTEDTNAPVEKEGVQYQIQHGYYVPYYVFHPRFDDAHRDEERLEAVHIFVRRFFRHVDPHINLSPGTDDQIALLREDYDAAANGYRKDALGAALVGRMVGRLEQLCGDRAIAARHRGEAGYPDEAVVMTKISFYSAMLMDQELLSCVRFKTNPRATSHENTQDKDGIIGEMVGEILKVIMLRTEKDTQRMMVDTRASKNGRAMKAIDDTGALMHQIINRHNGADFRSLKKRVSDFALAAKARESIAKFDKEAYAEADRNYAQRREIVYDLIDDIQNKNDRLGPRASASLDKDLEWLKSATGFIERMVEVRNPVVHHLSEIQAYLQQDRSAGRR